MSFSSLIPINGTVSLSKFDKLLLTIPYDISSKVDGNVKATTNLGIDPEAIYFAFVIITSNEPSYHVSSKK